MAANELAAKARAALSDFEANPNVDFGEFR